MKTKYNTQQKEHIQSSEARGKDSKANRKKTIAKDLKAHFNNKIITFGKFKDTKYENIPLYYLQWLLRNKDKFNIDEEDDYSKTIASHCDDYMFID